MLNEGFILLHRKACCSGNGMATRAPRGCLSICCLTADSRPQHWCGLKIRRGQRVASVAKLAGELNMTPRAPSPLALQRLTQSGEIACEPHARCTLYTVQKYGLYQGRWGRGGGARHKRRCQAIFRPCRRPRQGKLGAGRGQQWNKEQQPFCPPPQSAGGYDGMSLEQLFCTQAPPPAAEAAGRRARRRRRPETPGEHPTEGEKRDDRQAAQAAQDGADALQAGNGDA